MKKQFFSILFIVSLLSSFIFADEKSLLKSCEETGMTLYWDTMTGTGLLEKNGHQLSFRPDQCLVMLDSELFVKTDAPFVKDGEIKVSSDFLEIAENHFKPEQNGNGFKIGAILIDPGHGGKDPGAQGNYKVNGNAIQVREKDVVLSVGKMLYSRLTKAYPDKKIIMTRPDDKFLTLAERTEIANSVKLGPDEAVLYVSIHANASLDKKASGYEVWYLSPGYRRTVIDKKTTEGEDKSLFPILNSMMEEEYTTESILMSKFIMDGLSAQIGDEAKARGIKAEEWFVVKNSNMPAVLIEVGFVTNEKEALNLNKESYLQKTSLGIYNGIQAFVTHFERSRGFTK